MAGQCGISGFSHFIFLVFFLPRKFKAILHVRCAISFQSSFPGIFDRLAHFLGTQHVIQQCKNRLEQVRLRQRTVVRALGQSHCSRARGSNQRSQIHVHIYEALNIVFLTFLKGKRSLNCQIVA